MPKIDGPLKLAIAEKASDIHISSNEPLRIRIDGDMQVVGQEILTPEAVRELLFEILSEEEQKRFVEHKNLDKSINIGEGHFRVNMFFTRRGPAAVLRTIPKKIPTMAELGLPDSITKLTDLPKGLVLVTGPTGSGKSTTLASMLHHINLNFKYHILTVEDPIEFVHESRESLVNQREIGTNCHTFSDALKYALREDPDVILVGEMRDLETIALALTAAETGHLVFGTLHTRGAAASVDRIIDSFPGNQQAMIRTMLSESLAAVISQCLIKRAEGRGRAAAYEIMIVNNAIANLIREGKTFQMPSIMQTARKDGMVLMDQSILELVQKKVVNASEAAAYLEDPAILGPIQKGANAGGAAQGPRTNPSIKLPPSKAPPPGMPAMKQDKNDPKAVKPPTPANAPAEGASSPPAASAPPPQPSAAKVATPAAPGAPKAKPAFPPTAPTAVPVKPVPEDSAVISELTPADSLIADSDEISPDPNFISEPETDSVIRELMESAADLDGPSQMESGELPLSLDELPIDNTSGKIELTNSPVQGAQLNQAELLGDSELSIPSIPEESDAIFAVPIESKKVENKKIELSKMPPIAPMAVKKAENKGSPPAGVPPKNRFSAPPPIAANSNPVANKAPQMRPGPPPPKKVGNG